MVNVFHATSLMDGGVTTQNLHDFVKGFGYNAITTDPACALTEAQLNGAVIGVGNIGFDMVGGLEHTLGETQREICDASILELTDGAMWDEMYGEEVRDLYFRGCWHELAEYFHNMYCKSDDESSAE